MKSVLYVGSKQLKLKKIAFFNLLSFILLASIFTSTEITLAKSNILTSDIFVSENFVYIYVMDKGLQIVNVSNPNEPQFVSHLKMDYHYADDMIKANNYLYFSAYNPEDDSDEFFIVDVSDPQNPIFVNNFKLEQSAIPNFYILNNLLLFPHEKLEIINITNPLLPLKIGEYNIGSVKDICFKEESAYVLTKSNGLSIINISIPSNPTLINNYENITGSYLSLYDDYAIISRFRAIQILDISNISDISFVSSFAVEYLEGHFGNGDLIYYLKSDSISTSRIGIIDFSNPYFLSEILVHDTEESIRDMAVVDHYVYITTVETGMLILDTSDPSNPKTSSYYDIFLPYVHTRNVILISVVLLAGISIIPIWLRKNIVKREIYCPNCNVQNNVNWKHCTKCGFKL